MSRAMSFASRARRVLLRNIGAEGPVGSLAAVHPDDHERVLRDHLVIGGGGESVAFDVLSHDPARVDFEQRQDGSVEWFHPLADPSGHRHDRARLAAALHRQLGLAWRKVPPHDAVDVPPEAQAIFDRYLASARSRLFG